MSAPSPSAEDRFDLCATVDGRDILFERLELWWSEAEPPGQPFPSFTLTTSADAPGDAPRIEVECPARDATTFHDLSGESFALAPLEGDGGEWVSVDLGRGYKQRGFAARAWVAREARVTFDARGAGAIEGSFEASLERSAAKGGSPGAPVKIAGRFRARAPKW